MKKIVLKNFRNLKIFNEKSKKNQCKIKKFIEKNRLFDEISSKIFDQKFRQKVDFFQWTFLILHWIFLIFHWTFSDFEKFHFFSSLFNFFFRWKKKLIKKSKYSSPAKFPQESISDVFGTIWALLPRFWIELLFFRGFDKKKTGI